MREIAHQSGLYLSTVQETIDLAVIILFADAIGVALFLIAGLFLVRRLMIPVSEMTEVADAVRKGDFSKRVRTLTADELGLLGITLNRMSEEITKRISTISQERTQLKAMFSGMVEGIVAIGDDDRVLFCNEAADDMLQSNALVHRGKSVHEVKGLGPLLPIIFDARTHKKRFQREITVGDGDHVSVLETKASPFKGEQTAGVVVILHDVTELRRLERVRRDFVANVSHELKTPLTSIKGYVETLLGGAASDPEIATKFLTKIESNCDRLIELVQDILSLARVESQEHLLHIESIELDMLIRTVVAERQDDIKRKDLKFEFKSASQSMLVLGERESMRQIVDNLLTNAIKYTPNNGKIEIRLSESAGQAVLDVQDTGIGIEKTHLPRIFERFYRVDKARSREVGGTGLGLSIVKHLVGGMNGKVLVESQPGKGSCFTVRLDLLRR